MLTTKEPKALHRPAGEICCRSLPGPAVAAAAVNNVAGIVTSSSTDRLGAPQQLTIFIADCNTGKLGRSLSTRLVNGTPVGVCFSPDGHLVSVVSATDGYTTVEVFSLDGQQLHTFLPLRLHGKPSAVSFLSDRTTMLLTGSGGLHILSVESSRVALRRQMSGPPLLDVVAAAGRRPVAVGTDGHLSTVGDDIIGDTFASFPLAPTSGVAFSEFGGLAASGLNGCMVMETDGRDAAAHLPATAVRPVFNGPGTLTGCGLDGSTLWTAEKNPNTGWQPRQPIGVCREGVAALAVLTRGRVLVAHSCEPSVAVISPWGDAPSPATALTSRRSLR